MPVSNAQKKRKEDYRTVFNSPAGMRVLRDMMSTFHMGRSSHAPGDPYETSFREGERHAVLHILDMLGQRSDPEWLTESLDISTVEYAATVGYD